MHHYVIVNAFSNRPLAGNPVAVFFDCDGVETDVMQRIAAEMRFSESTFVSQPRHGGDAHVRIFTPVNELVFAGHPLLGTALALSLRLEKNALQIETAKGIFLFTLEYAERAGDSPVAHVDMVQPEPIIQTYAQTESLLRALELPHSTLPVEAYDVGPRHVFVGVGDLETLSALNPDQRALAQHKNMAALCFCRAGDLWRMRMFSPAYGVVEDAATGSAAGPLALHLARHGVADFGRPLEIWQGVEMGRPSQMYALAQTDGVGYRLYAGGHAIKVAQGTYFV
ncbi:2,3-dihydro-3-hydroxyanthranilate isomerase [Brenneria alni]|uniref:2,3-dihydro-3-hydroxyanthranilate isomerase n=1 Tax=Brenneria alni TaxID=71656 RepID=A0A421DSH7_9GAMM|nr:PhzF family phenazine biosynthesis protein [Brenneria alni]RLM27276.1 2,3-dihydro-3-hydroxyanthranilate isomerase [Brenneria alni]